MLIILYIITINIKKENKKFIYFLIDKYLKHLYQQKPLFNNWLNLKLTPTTMNLIRYSLKLLKKFIKIKQISCFFNRKDKPTPFSSLNTNGKLR